MLLADLMRLVGQRAAEPKAGAPAAGKKGAVQPGGRRGASSAGTKGLPAKAADIDRLFG
jgi:hypothetical protein